VYLNTGETSAGRYVSLVPNLQTEKWSFNSTYNYYSCPGLGKEGVLVMIGAGTTITAYKTALTNLKPVADFYAGNNIVVQFTSTNFFDLSSYNPTGWQWTFPGAQTATSNQQNPTNITYNTVGTYNVTLAATNGFGSDTLIRAGYIVVVPFIGVKQTGSEIPASFKLYQNYPNPFNPSTTIRYDIPPRKEVRGMILLKIYNIVGKEAATLVNENFSPGSYEINWNASDYPSGVYFYKLVAGDYNETKKMLLIK
jgi:PKD repeat protein